MDCPDCKKHYSCAASFSRHKKTCGQIDRRTKEAKTETAIIVQKPNKTHSDIEKVAEIFKPAANELFLTVQSQRKTIEEQQEQIALLMKHIASQDETIDSFIEIIQNLEKRIATQDEVIKEKEAFLNKTVNEMQKTMNELAIDNTRMKCGMEPIYLNKDNCSDSDEHLSPDSE